jgi:hypothetical protein
MGKIMKLENIIKNKKLIDSIQDKIIIEMEKVSPYNFDIFFYAVEFLIAYFLALAFSGFNYDFNILLITPFFIATFLSTSILRSFWLKSKNITENKLYNLIKSIYFRDNFFVSKSINDIEKEFKNNKEEMSEILEYTLLSFENNRKEKVSVKYYENLIMAKVEEMTEYELATKRDVIEKEINNFKNHEDREKALSLIIKKIGAKQEFKLINNKKIITI